MPRRKAVSDDIAAKARDLGGPLAKPERGRGWDKANPTFCFRIREEDAARLAGLAGELRVSKDVLARALLWAALDAAEAGELRLTVGEVTTEVEDKVGRVRAYTRRIVTPAWDSVRSPKAGDCGE